MARIDGPKKVNPNLSDFRDLPEDKQKQIASQGGKASGEARRRNKTFKDIALNLLDLKVPQHVLETIRKTFPELKEEDITNRMAILYCQLAKALKGDTKAFEVLRDTSGEKPKDHMELHNLDTTPIEVKVVK